MLEKLLGIYPVVKWRSRLGSLVSGISKESVSPIRERGGLSAFRAFLKTRSIWFFVLTISVIVVIEGFALSWGESGSHLSRVTGPKTLRTYPGPDICSKGATYRFIQVDYVRYGGGAEPAKVTGNVVTLHCGGPDDFQFYVRAVVETVSLGTNAKITLMTLANSPAFYVGTLKDLNNYLAYDEDGNIFLVTGPNSEATALTAEFHP